MLKKVESVRCTQVIAHVNVGFYDAQGNLVGEETFPQGEAGLIAARVFHPHGEELAALIEMCEQQAWQKLRALGLAGPTPEGDLPASAGPMGRTERAGTNNSRAQVEP